jgi:lipoprotein-anchoring transpeptidase ErfK/SrfK
MFGKTGFLISLAGLALLAVPEEKPEPKGAEISGVQAIDDRPNRLEAEPAADTRPAAIRALTVTRELGVERWLEPGQYAWDPEAAEAASGPATVVVNLRSRTLSVYRAGVEIGRSSILYGFGEHPTPLGTFPVMEKKRDHHSRKYNAPMPHMLRLTSDGVALHGSARLANDGATHGCVGLPREFAALLFDHVGVGDQVVIWSGRAGS